MTPQTSQTHDLVEQTKQHKSWCRFQLPYSQMIRYILEYKRIFFMISGSRDIKVVQNMSPGPHKSEP